MFLGSHLESFLDPSSRPYYFIPQALRNEDLPGLPYARHHQLFLMPLPLRQLFPDGLFHPAGPWRGRWCAS